MEKEKEENWKWNKGKLQNEEKTFSSLLFKPLKFVLGVPNGNFLPGKNISHREKNRKNDFAPSEKQSFYVPAWKWLI